MSAANEKHAARCREHATAAVDIVNAAQGIITQHARVHGRRAMFHAMRAAGEGEARSRKFARVGVVTHALLAAWRSDRL